jgi:hypothetical protein
MELQLPHDTTAIASHLTVKGCLVWRDLPG